MQCTARYGSTACRWCGLKLHVCRTDQWKRHPPSYHWPSTPKYLASSIGSPLSPSITPLHSFTFCLKSIFYADFPPLSTGPLPQDWAQVLLTVSSERRHLSVRQHRRQLWSWRPSVCSQTLVDCQFVTVYHIVQQKVERAHMVRISECLIGCVH